MEQNSQESQIILTKEKKALRNERVLLIVLVIMLIGALMISLGFGRYSIPIEQLFRVLGQKISGKTPLPEDKEADLVLFLIRLPRLLLNIMVGAALSVSGASFQGLFRNPMVSPGILGVSSAAGAGAALAILLNMNTLGVNLTAFFFGIGAVLLVMLLSRLVRHGGGALIVMVLSGVVISSIFRALTSLAKYVADADKKLPEITFWLMGSFAKSGNARNVVVMGIALLLGVAPLMAMRRRMNVLTFSEDEAQSMGVNVKRMRYLIIICSTLLTATSVCLCGTIEWIGLIIPHITRLMVGPNYRILLPASMLSGSIFMVVVDNFCRSIIPGELPIGVVTSLIGAPMFIYMLFKSRRELT